MPESPSAEEKYASVFKELAELVNQQSVEDRQRIRKGIGAFLHDLKHTLGLITGSNSVLARELADEGEGIEMLTIAENASMEIDAYLDLLSENFAAKINAKVEE